MSAVAGVSAPPLVENPFQDDCAACWQAGFLELLPRIRRDVRIAFRDLPGESREEAVQEAICNACAAYARLARQGRAEVATAGSLARYAVAQYRDGRRVGGSLNVKDVTSVHCQQRKQVRVTSLSRWDDQDGCWREMLVEDGRITPADLAASRIDYPAFLRSLSPHQRRIAQVLATGETTQRVAQRFRVSPGRISQLRQFLRAAWEAFHQPSQEALAAA